ncbi:MAG: hypothetical protein LBI01_03990 [Elusimicrobium sp.]|jgi:ADP-heptose:LPS heptosyltransferase|nr:hypothetical protein [Elusimicrobium sp.]
MLNGVIKRVMLMLGNPRVEDFDVKNAKSVLIRSWSGIGDSIVMSSAIRELKKNRPDIKIYVTQRSRSRDVYKNNPYIDKLYPYTFYHFLKLRNKADVYIDARDHMNAGNFLFYRVLNPKKVITGPRYSKYDVKMDDFSYYKDYKPADNGNKHVYDIMLDYFSEFNLKSGERKYDLYVSEKDLQTALAFWKKDKKRVLLNIFGSTKILDIPTVISLINNIQRDFNNLDIVIPFDGKTKERSLTLCGENGISNARLSYKTTVKELFALVKSSEMIISVDTGIVHIGSAFDKHMIAFYEKNIFAAWAPIGKNHDVILCKANDMGNGSAHYAFDAEQAEAVIRNRLCKI